ncbi:hypothetical protein Tco_0815303 [Tanacetum coccineum]
MIAEAIQKEHDNLRAEVILIKFEKITSATACRPSAIRPKELIDELFKTMCRHVGRIVAKSDYVWMETYSLGGNVIWTKLWNKKPNLVRLDDDEVPDDKVSQELLEHMLGEIDEAQLQKVVDEMLRQRCDSREEHQYHVKQDHIRRQKQLRDNPHEVYSESKIVEIIKTTYELGHEHKFITKIIVRRANGKIDPITELDYKYLNKNDIEDMYLLCINNKVKDYRETELLGSLVVFIRASVIWERVHDFQLGIESYQQKVNLTAPTITFPGIEKEERFTITSEPEKYKKDVKYGYANLSPSDDDAEYLRFYEEDIRECLKHRDQTRRWEMYVNERPLRSRRDRP